jgi:hypothetical protein
MHFRILEQRPHRSVVFAALLTMAGQPLTNG